MFRQLQGKTDLLRNYVHAHGLLGGSKLLLDVTLNNKAELTVSGRASTIAVRPHSSDRSVFHQVFVYRDYDHPCLPKDARVVVDAGANVGYASLFFADRYPQAAIVAIEPEAENFARLEANAARFPNIRPLRAALWPSHQRIDIVNPDDASWAFRVAESESGAVATVTVPELLERYGRIDVLKVDIEGAEKALFERGAEAWLDQVGTLVVETHDHFCPGCSEAVETALRGRVDARYEKGENSFFVLHAQRRERARRGRA